MKRTLVTAAAIWALSAFGAFAECQKMPNIEFVQIPPAAGDSIKLESIVVDGKQWTSKFLKSSAPGIVNFGVLPDCRVWIVGRSGLEYRLLIDDTAWKHSVYNSSFVLVNREGTKMVQADSNGLVLVNDTPQPRILGRLKSLMFDEHGDLRTTWDLDGREVVAINGKVTGGR